MSLLAILGLMCNTERPAVVVPNPYLYELAGQSNAEGAAPVATLPGDLSGTITGASIYNTQTLAWEALSTANNTGTADGYTPGVYFGIELRLMKLLYAHYAQPQYLIKYALGSTCLFQTNDPAKTLDGLDWNVNSTGELYTQSNLNHNTALSELGDSRPPKAFIWIQGEGDTNPGTYESYQDNLEDFIAAKRADYGYPAMPFIIVRLSNSQTVLNSTGLAAVRAAQNAVGAQANNYIIDTDGLAVQGDGVHYTAAAYDTIAQRIYDVLLTL